MLKHAVGMCGVVEVGQLEALCYGFGRFGRTLYLYTPTLFSHLDLLCVFFFQFQSHAAILDLF